MQGMFNAVDCMTDKVNDRRHFVLVGHHTAHEGPVSSVRTELGRPLKES